VQSNNLSFLASAGRRQRQAGLVYNDWESQRAKLRFLERAAGASDVPPGVCFSGSPVCA
jgi:hypothetical protein